MPPEFDFCVIGGGMSGLYFAKLLADCGQKTGKRRRCAILEADPLRFGGRAQVARMSNGVRVVEGAGVARVGKDRRLISLIRETGGEYAPAPKTIAYASSLGVHSSDDAVREIKRSLAKLHAAYRRIYTKYGETSTTTFREFGHKILGDSEYARFTTIVGFTDFEHANVRDTLFDYGFDDNYVSKQYSGGGASSSRISPVRWDDLVSSMVRTAKRAGFRMSKGTRVNAVVPLKGGDDRYDIERQRFEVRYTCLSTGRKGRLTTRHVVLATALHALEALLPMKQITRSMDTQCFMRVYVRVDRRSSREFRAAVRQYTVVPGVLQKVIPVDAAKGVYMAAYSDNANAAALYRMGFGKKGDASSLLTRKIEELLTDALSLSPGGVRVLEVRSFFWREGTHYFLPDATDSKKREEFLGETLSPRPGVLVLGEGFSRDQGWTEGALARAERAFELVR